MQANPGKKHVVLTRSPCRSWLLNVLHVTCVVMKNSHHVKLEPRGTSITGAPLRDQREILAMPLFEAFLDVEAGQHPAEHIRSRPPTIDPTRLRHRAPNSQRFVVGKA